MLDLAGCDENRCLDSYTADLAAVEGIPAGHCFGMNAMQVRTDCEVRRSLATKALELWMVSIAASVSAQHGLSQQCFSPQCDKALGIEMPWMQRPKPHSVL